MGRIAKVSLCAVFAIATSCDSKTASETRGATSVENSKHLELVLEELADRGIEHQVQGKWIHYRYSDREQVSSIIDSVTVSGPYGVWYGREESAQTYIELLKAAEIPIEYAEWTTMSFGSDGPAQYFEVAVPREYEDRARELEYKSMGVVSEQ